MHARPDLHALLAQANWLRKLARRLATDDAVADDLVQETYTAALEQQSAPPGPVRQWLRRLLKDRVRDERREARERARFEERTPHTPPVSAPSAEEALERARLQQRLAQAILELPEPYREAVTLRWIDALSPRDVARAQGITYEAARQRLSRGIAMLRTRLDKDYQGDRAAWSAIALSLPRPRVPHVDVPTPVKPLVGTVWIAACVVLLCVVGAWLSFTTEAPLALDAQARMPMERLRPARSNALREAPRATATSTRESVAVEPPIDRTLDLFGIVRSPSGEPVPFVRVAALRMVGGSYISLDHTFRGREELEREGTSDSLGRFALRLTPGSTYVLEAGRDGEPSTRLMYCYAGQRAEIELVGVATLDLTVRRRYDGSPIGGARVTAHARVTDAPGRTIRDPRKFDLGVTDAAGRLRVSNAPALHLELEIDGLVDAPGRLIQADLRTTTELFLAAELESGIALRGRVVDARDGSPLAGARIEERRRPGHVVESDADGRFVVQGVDGIAQAVLRVSARGFAERVVRMTRELDETVKLDPGMTLRGRLVDGRGLAIENAYVGAVANGHVDFDPKNPIENATVGTTSAADGSFVLQGVRRDLPQALIARHQSFGAQAWEFSSMQEARAHVDFGTLTLHDAALVRGRVVDEFGVPVSGCNIQVRSVQDERTRWTGERNAMLDLYIARRQTFTDDLGRFALTELAPGEHTISARTQNASALGAAVQTVTLRAGQQTLDVPDLTLVEGLVLAGRVVDERGAPVPRAHVSLRRAGSASAFVHSVGAEDGTFRITGLDAGDYTLGFEAISAKDLESVRRLAREIACSIPNDEELLVRLDVRYLVRGRLLRPGGAPVGGVAVAGRSLDGGVQSNVTDALGRFELAYESAQDVELWIGAPDTSTESAQMPRDARHVVRVRAGDSPLELHMH